MRVYVQRAISGGLHFINILTRGVSSSLQSREEVPFFVADADNLSSAFSSISSRILYKFAMNFLYLCFNSSKGASCSELTALSIVEETSSRSWTVCILSLGPFLDEQNSLIDSLAFCIAVFLSRSDCCKSRELLEARFDERRPGEGPLRDDAPSPSSVLIALSIGSLSLERFPKASLSGFSCIFKTRAPAEAINRGRPRCRSIY